MTSTALVASHNRPFDYAVFDPDKAHALRERAASIRKLRSNHIAAVVDAGRELIAVKEQLDHGQFSDWLQAECGFSLRTAENYMTASRFVDGKIANIAFLGLQPSTVYKLAAKGAPPDIVESVVNQTGRGEIVSDCQVIRALDDAKRIRREGKSGAKPQVRPQSARTIAKWEKRRRADQAFEDMVAGQRRQDMSDLIEMIGLNNARLVVEALQIGLREKFEELKRACEDPDEGAR